MHAVTQPDNQSPYPSDGTPPPYPTAPAYPAGYGGDPYNPYGVPQQRRNGLGIAGMVLGIISVVLFFLSWIAAIIGILAIIFGAVGRSRVKKGQATNKAQATAGLVLGIIGTVVGIVFLVFIVGRAKSCQDQYPEGGTQYQQCLIGNNS
jgi:hypothetical protein